MHLPDLRRWMEGRGHGDGSILASYAALLDGWELVWNYRSPARRGGAANVRERAGAVLPGVVLEVDAGGLRALDEKEGHPGRYSRGDALVGVRMSGGTTSAWLYVVRPEFRSEGVVPPRREYLEVVLAGARAHRLPEEHVSSLGRVPVFEDGDMPPELRTKDDA
ncbi:MAG: gamma-glutamylcyclotransferase [Deltaproteobacteria bacterium]|nr:gamma-glutamylcyclotransferase [Deltaproteobacteria bacterium]